MKIDLCQAIMPTEVTLRTITDGAVTAPLEVKSWPDAKNPHVVWMAVEGFEDRIQWNLEWGTVVTDSGAQEIAPDLGDMANVRLWLEFGAHVETRIVMMRRETGRPESVPEFSSMADADRWLEEH